jgi:hypothetical protein
MFGIAHSTDGAMAGRDRLSLPRQDTLSGVGDSLRTYEGAPSLHQ